MKKFLCIILMLMMYAVSFTAYAAEPTAQVYNGTDIINIIGKIQSDYLNDEITFLLKDKLSGDIKNIGQTDVNADGSYRFKFRFSGDVSECELYVKQGDADITNTVISAVSESEALVYSFNIVNSAGEVRTKAYIKNNFNIEDKTYTMVLAYYDESMNLVSVRSSNTKDILFDETEDTFSSDIPSGVKQIKAFLWQSLSQPVPLAESKKVNSENSPVVLAIGNSFVDDPLCYLRKIAQADGVDLNVTGAVHGGASLQNHWEAWESNNAYYAGNTKTIDDYLDNNLYDIITIQQVSHLSGDKDSYLPYAENMVKYLREKQPKAEIVLQETWAYEKGKTNDPAAMHNNTKSAVEYYCEYLAGLTTDSGLPISLDGKPLRYIPSGDAMWNARQNEMFDTTYTQGSGEVPVSTVTLWRDGYHCSYPYGRYLTGLVWYGCLTGNSIEENAFVNTQYPISDEAKAIIKEAVQQAITENGRW